LDRINEELQGKGGDLFEPTDDASLVVKKLEIGKPPVS